MVAVANPFRGRATGGVEGSPDLEEIRRALALLVDPAHSAEIRILPGGRSTICAGSDLDGLVTAASAASEARGVYYGLNPNSIPPGFTRAARKDDIVRRRWLLVDVDPDRPPDTNATESEHDTARELAAVALDYLHRQGWPLPVQVDSGNGWHLLYRIDLPNDDEVRQLVKGVLVALAKVCTMDGAKIDTAPHDAPRIAKLPGTWARKGPHSEERPHRLARVQHVPAVVEVVSRELLERLAAEPAPIDSRRVTPLAGRALPEGKTRLQVYVDSVVERELADLACAPLRTRNIQLNDSAFALGTLIGAGVLSRTDVEARLTGAALAIGLTPHEVRGTIRSGLNAGEKRPRDLTELRSADQPIANADTSTDPLDQDATAADLLIANVTIRWAWEGWLPAGVLSVLASEPGIGKTRLCADLARRVYHGLLWPDGAPATFPPGARTLWVPADNQHAELGSLVQAFGLPPECLYLNATRRNPFAGTMLDDQKDLQDFEARIRRVQPAIVIVDTTLNATDRSAHKPEDAKAFFVPLQQIASRTGAVVLCVTHLNAAGKPLGRRIQGQARLVMQLEKPDPEQEHRRKLYVVKSNSLYPPALGVTMGDNGNCYDLQPPCAPDEPGTARRRAEPEDPKLAEARDWLSQWLESGPRRVTDLRTDADRNGISARTLYRAKESLGVVETTESGRKIWRLPDPATQGGISTPWD